MDHLEFLEKEEHLVYLGDLDLKEIEAILDQEGTRVLWDLQVDQEMWDCL